ncbi:uncharacterized protein TEOVI_000497300 [Trypanosoma equiperdum]|nr:hypothetical protein TEOVI_000497300 [Trypanosoma equiperdum]
MGRWRPITPGRGKLPSALAASVGKYNVDARFEDASIPIKACAPEWHRGSANGRGQETASAVAGFYAAAECRGKYLNGAPAPSPNTSREAYSHTRCYSPGRRCEVESGSVKLGFSPLARGDEHVS